MSLEYLKPDTHHDDSGPPQEIMDMSAAQIRNPETWSNIALLNMLHMNLAYAEQMKNILKFRALHDDSEAQAILRTLNPKAESHVAPE